jgi:hypothetical protein
MRRLFAVLLFSGLVGCAVTGATDTFIVNGKLYKLDVHQMAQLRSAWVSNELAQRSQLSADTRQWVLDYLAIDARRICTRPRLSDLEILSVPMIVVGPDKKPTRAEQFNEVWTVDACGTLLRHRVFDHPYGAVGRSVAVVSISDKR